MAVVRVVLAEDSLVVRAGVEALLGTFDDVEVVGVAASFDGLLDAVATSVPDVVLTDIRMPPTHTDEGIRAADLLRRSQPSVGVVVLSQYLDPLQALALVEQGSRGRGYILKDRVVDTAQLVDALRSVASGGSFIDPVVVDALVSARSGGAGATLRRLTARELETLGEVARGKSNTAIAHDLGVTGRTVEKHINSIFAKLDLGEADDVHRRVASVLTYLSAGRARDGGAGTDDLGWRT
jgi:DNA-binding NarL/FixJ family response regulator